MHIEKLMEKGDDTFVIQIGSDTIKYGMANEKYPRKIKTMVGYKIK
jgi:actin-related protein